jgi:hypothetical protein
MASDEQYWKTVQAGREKLQSLLAEAKRHSDRLPEIESLVDQRIRVEGLLGRPEAGQKAEEVWQDLNSKISTFYSKFAAFTEKVRKVFEQLQDILPEAEIQRLEGEVRPESIGPTCRAVRRAAERLEEFCQCRPTDAIQGQASRESRLQAFTKKPEPSIASVGRAAHVYKSDMRKWRRNQLSDDSVMSNSPW